MLQETLEFFGLQRLPTQVGIFHSDPLKSATKSIKTAVNQGVGLVALLGPSGVGKTYLINKLWHEALAGGSYLVGKSNAPDKSQLTLSIILTEMIKSFGLRDRRSIALRFTEIEKFLLDAEKRVILLIDEGHRLKPGVLDQIRSLTDHEIEEEGQMRKLLTIIIAAQAKLRWVLRSGAFEATSWRFIEIWLDPLGRQIDDYISWVLTQCGADKMIISAQARQKIKKFATTPGEIKSLLWDALQVAYNQGEDVVSGEAILSAVRSDSNNLLAKINKQGFTVRDVMLQADTKKAVTEKVLRGIYRGKADCQERIRLAASEMLALSASPIKSAI